MKIYHHHGVAVTDLVSVFACLVLVGGNGNNNSNDGLFYWGFRSKYGLESAFGALRIELKKENLLCKTN